ncbi:MAG: Xaa-Pro peptidase family protein [Planctomycetota bacterium]
MNGGAQTSRRGLLGLGAAGALAGCTGTGARREESKYMSQARAKDELDEVFSDLSDQSSKHTPISDEERAARRRRLGGLLASAGIDALLVEPGATLSYLSGVSWGTSERLFGLVVLADGSHFWVSPAFEEERARARTTAAPGDVVTWHEHEYAYPPLAAALSARGVERVAVEPRARLFIAEGLADAHGRERVVSGRAVLRELRGRKDAHEVALLRAANELTQLAIRTAAERLRAGMTDADIGTWMRHAQERLGLTGTWVLPLINQDAALPHGSATQRVLERGDLILVDTGGSLHGYQSDNTRTWVFGGVPGAEVERVWHVVRDAQKRAFEALRPGQPCASVDRAARAVVTAAGFGEGYATFSHRLGHGIGMQGHEEPYLDGGNELILAPGMTFSDEPGIYLPGRFGVRIEDIVVVTEDGGDHFGTWQRSPASPD